MKTNRTSRCLVILVLLALVGWALYGRVALLSQAFIFGQAHTERPILEVLGLLGTAVVCYLVSIAVAVRCREGPALVWLIVLASLVFRLTLLWSKPIQEIDIYRYLWDGAVATSGVSPFRYSPQQVLSASVGDDLPEDLERLVRLRDGSSALATVLGRIHYGQLPTVYPPVSQAVFRAATFVTPEGAGVDARVVAMKSPFVMLDLATLLVVILLLRSVGRHAGWSVAYGWCPLVIKEFANAGHLDSLAVFLTTLAVLLTVQSRPWCGTPGHDRRRALLVPAAAIVLGLAVGAKLYAIVLVLLFSVTWFRHFGWRWCGAALGVFTVTVLVVLWPMLPARSSPGDVASTREPAGGVPPLPVDTSTLRRPQDPSLGLKTFLGRWEMNDFLFLVLVENVRPLAGTPDGQRPWFAVVPEAWRQRLVEPAARRLGVEASQAGFLVARAISSAVFLILAIWLAWRGGTVSGPAGWLRAAFLTLAWLWLLSPTQNPWYWTWALPLVMFGRSRAWLALSGLVLIYYLRFWFIYHWPEEPVPGTTYQGELFFDYVVTWLEFGPWFVWLAWDGWHHGVRSGRLRSSPA